MIRIIVDNEDLDIDTSTLVTFKKSQELNGLQSQYSYSNNFNLKNSSKNRRLLRINYLPNSKASAMTVGYKCDIVLNGAIFLKDQLVKVQKESAEFIPVYVLFSDSFFVTKAKATLMKQIDTGVVYTKNFTEFTALNSGENYRTAPISAQDTSGLVVIEEVPVLLNIVDLVGRVFTQLGYTFYGDILSDADLNEYYTTQDVGSYGSDGVPLFSDTLSCYDFVASVLKTFNAYVEVDDSAKSINFVLWKNIEGRKKQFVDYSSKFTDFKEYSFEGGLAKKNTVAYSSSPDFYNGFFENNKSVVESTSYLVSKFGAGSTRFFSDQETVELRTEDLISEPKTMNLYRFENAISENNLYYQQVLYSNQLLFRAVSPNILEIFNKFHFAYTKNISLPTIAQLNFRYDAIFLSKFKMQEVFFIKQLSTYWLPLELNFNTGKESVSVKALMIEKTKTDTPVVFDYNLSVDFYGFSEITNIFDLYSAENTSPASTMTLLSADLTKNKITVNGVEVLSFPTAIDLATLFLFKVENIDTVNRKDNSDVTYQMTSEEGGTSRIAKINVAHNGYATFVSEFKSNKDEVFGYGRDNVDSFSMFLNYCVLQGTPTNVPLSNNAQTGTGSLPAVTDSFRAITFQRNSFVKLTFSMSFANYLCSNRGGGAEARTKVTYNLYKNDVFFLTIHNGGVIDRYKKSSGNVSETVPPKSTTFNALAGDKISLMVLIEGSEEDRLGSGTMDGSFTFTNMIWKFEVTEQL